jgi:hypothetical protein
MRRALERLGVKAMRIVWPAFTMACLLELLLFAAVDPSAIRLFDFGEDLWGRTAVYSVSFFFLWATVTLWGALTGFFEPDVQPGPQR